LDTWEKIKEEYRNRAPREISEKSGVEYRPARGEFVLYYCGCRFNISYPEGHIKQGAFEVSLEEKIVFLQYLCWARSLPPRGEWLSFQDLPAGQHHYLPFQKEIIIPLVKKYGNDIAPFRRTGEKWGKKEDFGDVSYRIKVFPLVDLLVMLWAGDEEFAPRANILFDSVAPNHLPTATLYVMAIEAVRRIWLLP